MEKEIENIVKGKRGFQKGKNPFNYGMKVIDPKKKKELVSRIKLHSFKKGHTPWNNGLKLKGNPKYASYMHKLKVAAIKQHSKGKGNEDTIDMPRKWASDAKPTGIIARIKDIFGIMD